MEDRVNECGKGMRQNPQDKFPVCVVRYTVTCYIGWRMCCACKSGIFIWRTRDWRIVDTEIVDMRSRTRPERWAFISVIHRYVSNYRDTTRWCWRKLNIRHRTFHLSGSFLHSLYGAHYMQRRRRRIYGYQLSRRTSSDSVRIVSSRINFSSLAGQCSECCAPPEFPML